MGIDEAGEYRHSGQIEHARVLIHQRRDLLVRSERTDPISIDGDGARFGMRAAGLHGEHIGIADHGVDAHGYLAKCWRKSRGIRWMAKIVQAAPATAASCVIAMA